MVHDLLLLCRGIITQSSVGEGFAFLLAVRLIWILAVCWPLRQKAELSLVRWPCFGRVGRVLVWPGPQLVGAKPCALANKHHSAKRPLTSSKNYFQRLSPMHCNVSQIWPVPLPTFSKFRLS